MKILYSSTRSVNDKIYTQAGALRLLFRSPFYEGEGIVLLLSGYDCVHAFIYFI